ncbi:MAG: PDZ domain-containing protein [Planctomycetes bacterium]|nr:PDZ domain-containing protein [Planctomycetota bacterium]
MLRNPLSSICFVVIAGFACAGLADAQGARLGTSCVEKVGVKGAIVDRVAPESPAAEAGIEKGDIIVKMADSEISSLETFTNTFDQFKAGDEVEITYRKGSAEGELKSIKVKLGKVSAPPVTLQPSAPRVAERADRIKQQSERAKKTVERTKRTEPGEMGAGAPAAESMNGVAYLGVVTDDSGEYLKITDVVEGSAAEKAGLKTGDEIVSVAGKVVENQLELRGVIREHKPGEKINIKIRRDGKKMNIESELGQTIEDSAAIQIGQSTSEGMSAAARTQPRIGDALIQDAKNAQIHLELTALHAEIAGLRAEIVALHEQLNMLHNVMKKQKAKEVEGK